MGFRLTALFALLLLLALHTQALSSLFVQRAEEAHAQTGCCTADRCECCADSEDGCHCGCEETATPVVPAVYFCPQGCENPSAAELAHFQVPDYLPERHDLPNLFNASALVPGINPPLLPLPLLEPPEPPPRNS